MGFPGDVDVRWPPDGAQRSPAVVNLLAQWELGRALEYNRVPCPYIHGGPEGDTCTRREEWFGACLRKIPILLQKRPVSIAFPYMIGDGLAGGQWSSYKAMIG